MGSALLRGWLATSPLRTVSVIAPHEITVVPFLADSRVQWFSSPSALQAVPDFFVFAVKPFLLEDILPLYQSFDTLMVSVAAGKSLAFYDTLLSHHSVIRAMPNLPVGCCQGVIGLLPNAHVTQFQRTLVNTCFQGVGQCHWLGSDEDVDKLTAVAGSGPAYVFYLIEALAQGAQSLGFDPDVALELASQTFFGSIDYARESGNSPSLLRQQVTTPNGTTAAALRVFERGDLNGLMEAAVRAAFARAKELST